MATRKTGNISHQGHRMKVGSEAILPIVDVDTSVLTHLFQNPDKNMEFYSTCEDKEAALTLQFTFQKNSLSPLSLIKGISRQGNPEVDPYYSLRISKSEVEDMCENLKRRCYSTEMMDKSKILHPNPLEFIGMSFFYKAYPNKLICKLVSIVPDVSFEINQIPTLKIIDNPLSRALLDKGPTSENRMNGFHSGFITLDENRRVLPLFPSDPLISKYPMVGIWLYDCPMKDVLVATPESNNYNKSGEKGCSWMKNPYVWAACMRYLLWNSIKIRVSPQPDKGAFLIANFRPKSKTTFYEVRISSSKRSCAMNWIVLDIAQECSISNGVISSPFRTKLTTNKSTIRNLNFYKIIKFSHIYQSFDENAVMQSLQTSSESSDKSNSKLSSKMEINDNSKTIKASDIIIHDVSMISNAQTSINMSKLYKEESIQTLCISNDANDDLKENMSTEGIKLSQSDKEEMLNLKESINCGAQTLNSSIMNVNSKLSRNKTKLSESQNPSPKNDSHSIKKRNTEISLHNAQANLKSTNKSPHYYDNSQLERFPTFSGTSLTAFHTPENDTAHGDYTSPQSKKILIDNQKEIQELKTQVKNLTFMLMQMTSMQASQMCNFFQKEKDFLSPQYNDMNERYRQHMANCQKLSITPQLNAQISPSFVVNSTTKQGEPIISNVANEKKSPSVPFKQPCSIKSDETNKGKCTPTLPTYTDFKDRKDVSEFKADPRVIEYKTQPILDKIIEKKEITKEIEKVVVQENEKDKDKESEHSTDKNEMSKAEITLTSPSNMSYSMSNATMENVNPLKSSKIRTENNENLVPQQDTIKCTENTTNNLDKAKNKLTDSNWTFTVPKINYRDQSSDDEEN